VPSKKDYRHFNVKRVVGANDFATMKEVVNRRYSRMVEEESSLPQLVVIDGGRGQVNAAYEAMEELGLEKRIKIGRNRKKGLKSLLYRETLILFFWIKTALLLGF
jgi:Nuclease subunit of the excinuclease complex